MAEVINVQVTLHREGDFPNVGFLIPIVVDDLPADTDFSIDDVLAGAEAHAKDLLRPFLNNQAYFDTDTPAIPQMVNEWSGCSDFGGTGA